MLLLQKVKNIGSLIIWDSLKPRSCFPVFRFSVAKLAETNCQVLNNFQVVSHWTVEHTAISFAADTLEVVPSSGNLWVWNTHPQTEISSVINPKAECRENRYVRFLFVLSNENTTLNNFDKRNPIKLTFQLSLWPVCSETAADCSLPSTFSLVHTW